MSDPALDAALPAAPLAPAATRPTAGAMANEQVLDTMRGFAALLVAYFHCRQVTWIGMGAFHHSAAGTHLAAPGTIAAWLTLPVAWGSAGVPIFFVISGYCIHRSGAARLFADPNYRLDARQFWLRRFVRIYPVLFAALVLTAAVDWFSLSLPPVSHKILDIGPRAFLVNLLSLQGLAGKTYGSNGALWTLSIEVQFYAIYPLLFALRRRIGLNATLVGVALVNIVSALTLERHDVIVFPSFWFSWMLGVWIAEVRLRNPDARIRYGNALALLFVAAGCVAFRFGQYGAFQLWAAGFACWLTNALGRPATASGPLAHVLAKIGDFSYSLYLIHLPLFVLGASLLFRSSLQASIWPSFEFTLMVVPVAWVFYQLFERPALLATKRLKKRPVAAG
ncbi:MAG TPA: acyltransferase [Paraburkholderia sp.]|jgi:peptidoglycan/LPS O-acetylase OafA/YrhL|nr:acyltransferase [Paraburkholderia sp.]